MPEVDKSIGNKLGQGERQPAQSYIVMASIVVLAGIFSSLIECKVPSILVPLSKQFGMDAATGSLMMSVFTFMGIFFSIPASAVIARIGAKRVLINSVFVMIAGSLLGTFAPNAVVLILSRALEGIALVSTTIAGVTFIQNSAPPDRMGTAIGIWSAWFALGSFSAGVLSPVIYEAFGFQALWLIYAALAASAAACIKLFVKAPNVIVGVNAAAGGGGVGASATETTMDVAGTGTANTANTASAADTATAKPRYRELAVRDVILVLLVFAIYNLLSLAVVTYVPTILQMQGYEASLSGFITTLPMLISIVSALLLGILSDRLGRVKVLLSGAFLVFAITSSLMFISTGPQIWIVAIISGIFGCSAASLLMVSYLLVLPRPQLVPLAVGVFSTMQGLGQFLGSFLLPFLLGPELDNWYLAAGALFVIGMLGFVASVICKYR